MMRLTEADLIPGQNVKDLHCSICSEIFLDPVFFEGKCQCVFCRDCITNGLQAKSKCPVCETEVTAKVLKPHLWVRNALKELQVPCPNKCLWTGSHESRSEHLTSCPVPRIQKEGQEIEKKLQVNEERQLDLKKELTALQEEKSRLEQQRQELNEEAMSKTFLKFDSQQQSKVFSPDNCGPMMGSGPCGNLNEMAMSMGKGCGGASGPSTGPMGGMPMPFAPVPSTINAPGTGKPWLDNNGKGGAMGGMPTMNMPMKGGKGGTWMVCGPQMGPGPCPPMQQMPFTGSFMFDLNEPLTPATLAKVPLSLQKQLLGEKLCPLIAKTHPAPARSLTSMLLEMENNDILHLLDCEEALLQKVDEILRILGQPSGQDM